MLDQANPVANVTTAEAVHVHHLLGQLASAKDLGCEKRMLLKADTFE